MKILKNNRFKIQIKPSFFVIMFIMIALDFTEQFFVILSAVTLHELSHILTAKIFKLKVEKMIFTPIGEIAVIKELESLNVLKKLLVVFAGPAINIFIVLIFYFIGNEKFNLYKNINLSIAFFNLLPIYPFDGGRIIQYILSYNIGVLNANKILIKLSSILSIIIFILGIIQLILFPYNISLMCIGFYLIKINKKEHFNMTFEFYKFIINKKINKNKISNVKMFLIDKNLCVKNIVRKLCWDYYTVLYVSENNMVKWIITENNIINYIQIRGINGTIDDIIEEKNVKLIDIKMY